MKIIYLSGPILSRTEDEANEWRQKAIKELQEPGEITGAGRLPPIFQCLDPMRREFSDDDMMGVNEIVQMDIEDVKAADILLVNYNIKRKETTLCGTSMEVLLASQLGKYIVVFSDLPREKMSPWIIYHSTRILPSLDEAIEYIKKHF